MNARPLIAGTIATVVAAGFGITGSLGVSAATVTPASPAPTPVASPTPTPVHHDHDLAALKARCDIEVQRRFGSLHSDAQYVSAAGSLTRADRTTLTSQIAADVTGLTALDATIQADTTWDKAHTDCIKIVDGYHVYVMEEPKIHEVIAADGVGAANGTFTSLIPQLQALINSSTVSAAQKAAAQTALNDLQSKVIASQTSISGVTPSVINLTASGYPGNKVDLQSARHNITTARADLDGARKDVSTVFHDLGG